MVNLSIVVMSDKMEGHRWSREITSDGTWILWNIKIKGNTFNSSVLTWVEQKSHSKRVTSWQFITELSLFEKGDKVVSHLKTENDVWLFFGFRIKYNSMMIYLVQKFIHFLMLSSVLLVCKRGQEIQYCSVLFPSSPLYTTFQKVEKKKKKSTNIVVKTFRAWKW